MEVEMIFDRMANHQRYNVLSPLIARAFEHIRTTDMPALSAGNYAIAGNDLYAVVSEYTTKPEAAGKWEAHRRYIDLQYMVRGVERIGFAPATGMKPGAYDSEKDFLLLEGRGDFLTVHESDFMVLWPDDAHMPGIEVSGPSPVKKAVFKIRVG
jgi:YhcH/YjgK/YiaL family protein